MIVGEELRTHAGEIIGLFLDRADPDRHAARDAARAIRDQGGVVYVPHPFDPMRRNLAEPALDALDRRRAGRRDRGASTPRRRCAASTSAPARLAAEHGLAAGAGSDAHVPDAIGAAYVEMPDFDGPADFLAKLRRRPAGRSSLGRTAAVVAASPSPSTHQSS